MSLGIMGASAAFAQAAGRGGKEKFTGFILRSLTADPSLSSVTCEGEMTVKTIKNGIEHVEQYADLEGEMLSITADKNTKIYISGNLTGEWEIGTNTDFVSIKGANTALTQLDCSTCSALQELNLSANTALTQLDCSNCYVLQELNLSANTALTQLSCSTCYALQELNLSANTALTQLNCNDCAKLVSISYPATNSDVSTEIAGAITNADADNGTVYTDSAADYYSTIADAATAKGWTIAPLA